MIAWSIAKRTGIHLSQAAKHTDVRSQFCEWLEAGSDFPSLAFGAGEPPIRVGSIWEKHPSKSNCRTGFRLASQESSSWLHRLQQRKGKGYAGTT